MDERDKISGFIFNLEGVKETDPKHLFDTSIKTIYYTYFHKQQNGELTTIDKDRMYFTEQQLSPALLALHSDKDLTISLEGEYYFVIRDANFQEKFKFQFLEDTRGELSAQQIELVLAVEYLSEPAIHRSR